MLSSEDDSDSLSGISISITVIGRDDIDVDILLYVIVLNTSSKNDNDEGLEFGTEGNQGCNPIPKNHDGRQIGRRIFLLSYEHHVVVYFRTALVTTTTDITTLKNRTTKNNTAAKRGTTTTKICHDLKYEFSVKINTSDRSYYCMSVTQLYNLIFLIFFMGGPEGTNLLNHFAAEVVDIYGFPVRDNSYERYQREYNGPANQDPFSGLQIYEARATPAPTPAPAPFPVERSTPRERAIVRRQERQEAMGDDWNMFKSSYRGIKDAARAWKLYKNIFPHAGMKREMETTMTKDMIIGPHRKKKLGTRKKVNVGQQLKQLVDDTKVFKQQFKFKITSGDGIRNWAQVVCRHRQTPGRDSGGEFYPNGVILDPDVMADVPMLLNNSYYYGLPPVPIGKYQESGNYWVFGQGGPPEEPLAPPKNLMYLNMPLTYLEQDMYNMCLGPGKRDFTQYMLTQGRNVNENAKYLSTEVDETGQPTTAVGSEVTGIYQGRLTTMMQRVNPIMQYASFNLPGSQVNEDLLKNGALVTTESNAQSLAALDGWNVNKGIYPFQKGWGIHQLDYTLVGAAADPTDSLPANRDPQWLKTNNSYNTKATIKSGKISLSYNNMGESQCYITTLVVVNKHVDSHYYSMPQALTDQYLKCAQQYIDSGEWSITNNVTDPNQSSSGDYVDAYMHITHPSIKPFGKVPTRFLDDFYKHFTIKEQRTTKLGIGERQSLSIDLGGLTYTTEQIAMTFNTQLKDTPPNQAEYFPVEEALTSGTPDVKAGMRAVFPLCCQQGTTHFLFRLQGMSLPYVQETNGEPDVTKVEGRWAVPALVDISGTYTEVIGPLQVVPKNATPRQKTKTALPDSNWKPIVTTLPRVRTANTGQMTVSLT